jgi:hypothetical protein
LKKTNVDNVGRLQSSPDASILSEECTNYSSDTKKTV